MALARRTKVRGRGREIKLDVVMTASLHLRVTDAMLADLDAEAAAIKAEQPGMPATRQDVARSILLQGLAARQATRRQKVATKEIDLILAEEKFKS